jgi:hypothetical protein
MFVWSEVIDMRKQGRIWKEMKGIRAGTVLITNNVRAAKRRWRNQLSPASLALLRSISKEFGFSVANGDLLLLDNSWYVTHAGLVRLARRNRCFGIETRPAAQFCEPASSRWVFKAIVYKSRTCRGFVGYGDADQSNVSPKVRGAEMRVAETRAVNRALRKAYGIGICSVEELGSFSGPLPPTTSQACATITSNGNGEHPLRDRLCLLIRQHRLDPALVKTYAADYCDVAELRQASREQVAAFIKHLAEYAQSDRDGLLCQLNSYAPKPVSAASVDGSGEIPTAEQEKTAGAA